MNASSRTLGILPRWLALLLPSVALALAGCGQIAAVKGQIDAIDQRASITGRVIFPPEDRDSIVIATFTPEGPKRFQRNSWLRPDDNGTFRFWVPPGAYYVVAFVDADNDQELRPGERFAYAGEGGPSVIDLGPGSQVQMPDLVIGDSQLPDRLPQIDYRQESFRRHLGEVVTLDDRAFARGYYQLGLWKPLDFATQAKPGIFLLKPFAPGRIPVLLIHGMSGGPLDWVTLAPELEKARLQPMVAYYPSGLNLSMVVDYMAASIEELRLQFGFDRMHIVAHSMGGLVARELARSLVGQAQRLTVLSLTTINTPMEGIASAATGVARSWLVIPSWRDVAKDSEFIRRLEEWPWPSQIPYYLVFSYRRSSDSDGVVPLESSIPLWVQEEATSMRGFQGNHVDVLHNPHAIEYIVGNLTGG